MPILGVAGDHIERKKPRKKKLTPEQQAARLTRRREKRLAKKRAKKVWQESQRWLERKKNPEAAVRLNSEGRGRFRRFQLYALRGEGNRFYVGMTAYWDASRRFEEHVSGKGAKWTAMYPPIEIIETRQLGEMYESEACERENDMTVEYMLKYGTELVRGGNMCSLNHAKVDKIFRSHVRRQLTERKVAA